jgi:2-oxoglutarate ferredoxin oxidoreductase subunit gamma
MKMPLRICLCGFGGQGIILSAVVLGTASVTRGGLYAVQTQSYGSEARGGQCQAELIISSSPIASPVAEKKNLLVCMFQEAHDKYIGTLEEGGILVVDSGLVPRPGRTGENCFRIPATEIAISLGNKMAANMVMLGFLSACCDLVNPNDLKATIAEQVSPRFVELNLKAVDAGIAYARENGLYIAEQ